MRILSVSVIIPTLNEMGNIAHVLDRIPHSIHQVIIVDGHSEDDTVAVARRKRPGIEIVMQSRTGRGNALACGFAVATGEIIAVVAGDGSADPAEIPRFVDALIAGADFAKGTRFADGGGSSTITRLGRLGNDFVTSIFNLVYGRRYSDLCYGYNVFWRSCLPELRLDADTPRPLDGSQLWGDGSEIDVLIAARAARAGLRVAEVPSYEYPRLSGSSNRQEFKDSLRMLRAIGPERPEYRKRVSADIWTDASHENIGRAAVSVDPAEAATAFTEDPVLSEAWFEIQDDLQRIYSAIGPPPLRANLRSA